MQVMRPPVTENRQVWLQDAVRIMAASIGPVMPDRATMHRALEVFVMEWCKFRGVDVPPSMPQTVMSYCVAVFPVAKPKVKPQRWPFDRPRGL